MFRKKSDLETLTHFRPMFDLSRNQEVVFYQQNIWKTPAEEWYFKYPASLLKMPLFSRCFSNIFLVKTNYLVYLQVYQVFLQEAASLRFPVKKQHQRTFSWPWERPYSKLLKWELIYLLSTFRDYFLQFFTAGKASPV